MNPGSGPDVKVAISVAKDESEALAADLRRAGAEVSTVADQGFDGAHAIDLLVTLTPPLIGVIAGIYATRIRANRHISLKYKGLEVKGVSEKTLLKLYEKAKQGKPVTKARK